MRALLLSIIPTLIAGAALAQAGPGPAETFAEARAICETDGGALWGAPLCTPVLLVDPATRTVHTARRGDSDALKPEGGLFVGTLPETVNIANTAVDWDGVRWAMLIRPLPENPTERRALLAHEIWHGVQRDLGLPAGSPTRDHLSRTEGRVRRRLEWGALAAALRAADPAARDQAVADALAFRAARRTLTAQAGDQERQLEMNEGLAQYTGVRLSGGDAVAEALKGLALAEEQNSFVRNFAYFSGPPYGLLLDAAAPDWRRGLGAGDALGALLAARTGAPPVEAPAAEARYDGVGTRADEARRAERARAAAAAWTAKLVDGPRLTLAFEDMNISFNPSTIVVLGGNGAVYPTLRVVDSWGVLEVTDGALIDPNWTRVTVAAPTSADGREGPGWTLRLNPDRALEPGDRPGDFRLRAR